MQQEIRKLQTLNDLVAQTLDVLTQLNHRVNFGGLSHAPFAPDFTQVGVPYGVTSGPFGYGSAVPMSGYQLPFAPSIAQGLAHSPFSGIGQYVAPWQTLSNGVGQYTPFIGGVSGGLGHTPVGAIGTFGIGPFGQNGAIPGFGVDPRVFGMGMTQPRYGYSMAGW